MIGKTAAALALALTFGGAAQAGEAVVGIYKHDVTFIGETFGLGAAGREGGTDIQIGYRTDRIQALRWLGRPQVHALASVNTKNTSNFVASGFSWPIRLKGRAYFRPGLGLAYTDGEAGLPPVNAPGLSREEIQRRLRLYNTRIDFGSHVLFQPELNLGWRFNDRWAAELSYVHLSNGQVFHQGKNQGLDDAGVRLVYSF
jgi:lipid A 3-O-deacylase